MPLRPVAIAALALLVCGVVLGLALPVAALLSGHHLVKVAGASMSPTLSRGAVLAVDPTAPVRAGDVLTFMAPVNYAGDKVGQAVVTHRVLAVSAAGITTVGDANTSADPTPVEPSEVLGVADKTWMPLSTAMGAATSPAGMVATYLPALGVLLVGWLRRPRPLAQVSR